MKQAAKVVYIRKTELFTGSLPDGVYSGRWGGYIVTVKIGDVIYELQTEMGIRTLSAPCTVTVVDGVPTVT